MKILISDAFDPSLPDKLQRLGEVTDDKSQLPTADVVLVRSKTKCTPEYIDSAPNLKMIIRGGVGMDNIDLPYATSKGIRCLNTADASTTAVASSEGTGGGREAGSGRREALQGEVLGLALELLARD